MQFLVLEYFAVPPLSYKKNDWRFEVKLKIFLSRWYFFILFSTNPCPLFKHYIHLFTAQIFAMKLCTTNTSISRCQRSYFFSFCFECFQIPTILRASAFRAAAVSDLQNIVQLLWQFQHSSSSTVQQTSIRRIVVCFIFHLFCCANNLMTNRFLFCY